MRDLIKIMLKAPLAHKVLYVILSLYALNTEAQDQLTNEEYRVINTIFNGEKTHIYEMTLFDKSWAHYFEKPKEIIENVGIPTKISDSELMEILNKGTLSKIHSSISRLKPYQLSSEKMNNHIELSDDFDSKKAFKKGVFRISKPIIVNDTIAVIKKVSIHESPIFILEKDNNEWQIIYTFYDWLILN